MNRGPLFDPSEAVAIELKNSGKLRYATSSLSRAVHTCPPSSFFSFPFSPPPFLRLRLHVARDVSTYKYARCRGDKATGCASLLMNNASPHGLILFFDVIFAEHRWNRCSWYVRRFVPDFLPSCFWKKKRKTRWKLFLFIHTSIEVQLSPFIRFGYSIMVVNIVTVSRNCVSDSCQKVSQKVFSSILSSPSFLYSYSGLLGLDRERNTEIQRGEVRILKVEVEGIKLL